MDGPAISGQAVALLAPPGPRRRPAPRARKPASSSPPPAARAVVALACGVLAVGLPGRRGGGAAPPRWRWCCTRLLEAPARSGEASCAEGVRTPSPGSTTGSTADTATGDFNGLRSRKRNLRPSSPAWRASPPPARLAAGNPAGHLLRLAARGTARRPAAGEQRPPGGARRLRRRRRPGGVRPGGGEDGAVRRRYPRARSSASGWPTPAGRRTSSPRRSECPPGRGDERRRQGGDQVSATPVAGWTRRVRQAWRACEGRPGAGGPP